MITTAILNGVLGLIMTITYCFCVTDLNDALNSPTGYPFIQVFYSATGSKAGATAMACIPIVLLIAACISVLATASRQTFAFARDDGLPMGHIWRKVYRIGTELPLNAVLLSLSITVILAIINIGSTAAFNSIISLLVSSLFTAYFISISCILIKRLRGEPLPPSRWSMGRFAIPCNIIALLYITLALVVSFFPIYKQVTAMSMNWSVLVWGVIVIFATIVYVVSGRYVYKGPVVFVMKPEDMEDREPENMGQAY
jgi:choline transport protein